MSPTVPWAVGCVLRGPCVSSIGAESPETTPSDTDGTACSCCPVPTDQAMPEPVADVLERLDSHLEVQHEGRIVPSQEASPHPSVLRGFAGRTLHTPGSHLPNYGLGSKWVDRLANLVAAHEAKMPPAASNHNGTERSRPTATRRRRRLSALQKARWKAVQKAKRKGLSIRRIAQELGMHRETVRKCMNAERPPVVRSRLTSKGP